MLLPEHSRFVNEHRLLLVFFPNLLTVNVSTLHSAIVRNLFDHTTEMQRLLKERKTGFRANCQLSITNYQSLEKSWKNRSTGGVQDGRKSTGISLSRCFRAGIRAKSFAIPRNLCRASQCGVCARRSCSCSEYIILVLHRGRPRPSKGPLHRDNLYFLHPVLSKLLRANAIRDRARHQLYLPQTRSYLARLPDTRAKFERNCPDAMP